MCRKQCKSGRNKHHRGSPGDHLLLPENSEMPEIQTVPVRVTYDGKPHTFDIKQEDGVQISYSLTENGSYTQTEMPFYTEAGQYKIYFKAEKASFIPTYGEAVLEIEKASTSMQLTAKTIRSKVRGQ